MDKTIERMGYGREIYFTRGNQIQDTRILCGSSDDGSEGWGFHDPGMPLEALLIATTEASALFEDARITVIWGRGNYGAALAVRGWREITDSDLEMFAEVEREERESAERLRALNEATLREELRKLAREYPDEVE